VNCDDPGRASLWATFNLRHTTSRRRPSTVASPKPTTPGRHSTWSRRHTDFPSEPPPNCTTPLWAPVGEGRGGWGHRVAEVDIELELYACVRDGGVHEVPAGEGPRLLLARRPGFVDVPDPWLEMRSSGQKLAAALNGHREQITAWADKYAADGWPEKGPDRARSSPQPGFQGGPAGSWHCLAAGRRRLDLRTLRQAGPPPPPPSLPSSSCPPGWHRTRRPRTALIAFAPAEEVRVVGPGGGPAPSEDEGIPGETGLEVYGDSAYGSGQARADYRAAGHDPRR